MMPRAVSPARATACAAELSDARLALLLIRVAEVVGILLTTFARREKTSACLPGAPFKAWLGQRGRTEESGGAGEIKRVKRRFCRRVPCGERGEVPFLLDDFEHGGVVEGFRAHVIGPRVRGHDHGR